MTLIQTSNGIVIALEGEHALADLVEQVGVGAGGGVELVGGIERVGHLGGVRVITADGAEEDLAVHVEGGRAARLDEAGDHFELVAQAGGGERRVPNPGAALGDLDGGGDAAVEQVAGDDGAVEHAAVGLALEVRVAEGDEVLHRLHTRLAAGHQGPAERDSTSLGNMVLRDQVADFEGVVAIQGDGHGDIPRRVGHGVQQIRHAPAPAGDGRLVGDGGLPLGDLVAVGEDLRRAVKSGVGEVLRAGGGADQGAHVHDSGQLALAEQGAQFLAGGVKTQGVAVSVHIRGITAAGSRSQSQQRG